MAVPRLLKGPELSPVDRQRWRRRPDSMPVRSNVDAAIAPAVTVTASTLAVAVFAVTVVSVWYPVGATFEFECDS